MAAWRERPLTAARYPYLSVDARYEHVRVDGRVVSQGVLLVAGVREDGRREVLAVEVADTESEATYEALFRRLKARGLQGVALVTSDDHAGLRAAIARHFQGAQLAALPGPLRAQPAGAGRGQAPGAVGEPICAASSRRRARHRPAPRRGPAPPTGGQPPPWRARWRRSSRTAWPATRVPAAHRPRVRTTNGLERFNQELKRRTRVVRIFPNRAALLRLVTALAMEQSEEWVQRAALPDMEPLEEVPAPAATPVAQAA